MEKSWRNGRRIGRHCQIRLSHARRPWKKRKKGGEGKRRSGRTRNKNGGEKGKDEEEEGGSEEEEEGGGIRGRFPTLSTGRVSAVDCGLVREFSWEDAILFSYVGIHCPPTRCPATPLHKLTDGR